LFIAFEIMTDIPQITERAKIIKQARRVVIKLGTAVLMREDKGIALSRFYSFVEAIADIKQSGSRCSIGIVGRCGAGR
jgi:glutamate 5-kinase